ncbi:MAG: hypothetical protein WD770_04165 [Actinomycetota bacterium]
MSARPATPGGPLFWTLAVLGWGLIAAGIVGGLRNVTSVPHWIAWLVGGVAVHDLVVAPVVAGIGRVLRRTTGAWFRAYVQGSLAFTALVAAVALPNALAFGRDPRNPSGLPANVWGGALLLLLESLLVWGLVRSLRGLRRSLRSA